MKTKKIIAAVAAFAIVCGAVPSQPFASIVKNSAVTASAALTGKCGENLTFTLDDEDVLTINGTGDMYDFGTMPPPWMGDYVKAVVINNGVTSISDYAISVCPLVTSVTIPESVTRIGESAFSSVCLNLTSINVSENNKSYSSEDGILYSKDKTKLICYPSGKEDTEYVIPDSVTIMSKYAFGGCYSLTSVTIPDSVKSIDKDVFFNCYRLTEITVPDSVTSIDDFALGFTQDEYGAYTKIKGFTIKGYKGSAAETYAMENEFEFIAIDDSEETSDFEFDAETGTITKYNGKDAEVVIPAEIDGVAVTAIGDHALEGCDNLNSITIPEGITSIGGYAFRGCERLTSVTIPDSVTSIGNEAFAWCGINEITIPNSITSLSDGLFYYCVNLESITIPDSVTSIGNGAFHACSSLTSIIIPASVTCIDNNTFYGCTSLTNITIPESVTSIGECVFFGCEGLKSITIPESVTEIGEAAFYWCESLESITIPDGVTSIGESAFESCSSLTEITIPDSVTNIGYKAFGFERDVNYDTVKKEGFTISGYAGSAAEAYAKENEFEFIVLDDEPITETKLGDIDGDGTISAMDASAALTYYVTQPEKIEDLGFPFNEKAADWDGNGVIDARDASAILTYYVNNN